MKARNKHRHDSYTCFLKIVVKFSVAGKTNFSSVFKYRAVPSPPYQHNVDLTKRTCLFSMKAWNRHRHDSYTCFLKNVVQFSFAGKANFSSIFQYGAVPSPPYGHNVDLSKSSCHFSIWEPETNTAMTHTRVLWKSL